MGAPRDYHTKSETERQIQYNITYMWNLNYDTNELIYETDSQAQRIDLWLPRRRGVGGMNWEFGIQFSSVAQLCPTLCDSMDCSTPGFPVHHQLPELLKLTSIKSVMPFNHLILCRPLLLLPSVFPSIKVIFSESVFRIRWPKDWSFSFSINPSNEYSGLISFRTDLFDVLAVQRTLKGLLQHHSSKASILWCSAFFLSNSHIHT